MVVQIVTEQLDVRNSIGCDKRIREMPWENHYSNHERLAVGLVTDAGKQCTKSNITNVIAHVQALNPANLQRRIPVTVKNLRSILNGRLPPSVDKFLRGVRRSVMWKA